MTRMRPDRAENRLLNAIPAAERRRVVGLGETVTLDVRKVLFEPGRPVQSVYFPYSGVISLVTPLRDGHVVEVATVGNEGVVGVPLFAGGALTVCAVSQFRGSGLRVPAAAFLAEAARGTSLSDVVNRYLAALFGQISQAVACNRLHSSEERLSRWLLTTHDRVGRDHFSITHELLSQMLGSSRVTVTLSAGTLQTAGLIEYRRGQLTILNRSGLQQVACECYAAIKHALDGAIAGPHQGNEYITHQDARARNGVAE